MTTLLNLDPSEVPSDGQVLAYDAASTKWLPVTPSGGGGSASALDDLTDVDTAGQTTGDVLKFNGTTWVADAASAGTVTSTDISDSSAVGRSVLTAADAATARTAIGAGTSSFSGAYADLSGKPTLGTAAAAATGDFATAAQGTKADAAIPSGLVDAKGDLIVATAADTVTRLPAGTNGHVLTADSAEAAGVKWAAPSGGNQVADLAGVAIPHPPGSWLREVHSYPVNVDDDWAYNNAKAHVFFVTQETTIDALRVYFRAANGKAGSTLEIGIYDSWGSTGLPRDLLRNVTVPGDVSPAWVVGVLGSPVTLAPGIYWLATSPSNTTPPPATLSVGGPSPAGIVGRAPIAGYPHGVLTFGRGPLSSQYSEGQVFSDQNRMHTLVEARAL